MEMEKPVSLQKVLFLDRDGVLIEDRPNYVRSWDDVKILPSSLTAARLVSDAGFGIVVVSNQAGIGRGIVTEETARVIFDQILDEYRSFGANILAGYMCPHRPEDQCDCRKPKPGMILQAARDHRIDLGGSVLVGDALRDLQAAEAAGVTGMLVRTGLGLENEKNVVSIGAGRWTVHNDLLQAVPSILSVLQGS